LTHRSSDTCSQRWGDVGRGVPGPKHASPAVVTVQAADIDRVLLRAWARHAEADTVTVAAGATGETGVCCAGERDYDRHSVRWRGGRLQSVSPSEDLRDACLGRRSSERRPALSTRVDSKATRRAQTTNETDAFVDVNYVLSASTGTSLRVFLSRHPIGQIYGVVWNLPMD